SRVRCIALLDARNLAAELFEQFEEQPERGLRSGGLVADGPGPAQATRPLESMPQPFAEPPVEPAAEFVDAVGAEGDVIPVAHAFHLVEGPVPDEHRRPSTTRLEEVVQVAADWV